MKINNKKTSIDKLNTKGKENMSKALFFNIKATSSEPQAKTR